jgi:hypothetical protein
MKQASKRSNKRRRTPAKRLKKAAKGAYNVAAGIAGTASLTGKPRAGEKRSIRRMHRGVTQIKKSVSKNPKKITNFRAKKYRSSSKG